MKIRLARKIFLLLCVAISSAETWSEAVAAPTSVAVTLDGIPVKDVKAPIIVPSSTKITAIQVGDIPKLADPMVRMQRIRYRMEGVDARWLQREGTMSFYLFFYNQAGDKIGQVLYEVQGFSSGWKESMDNSTFTHRSETFTVPPLATAMNVVISSAGPEDCVGVYLVEDILVTKNPKGHDSSEVILKGSSPVRIGTSSNGSEVEWHAVGDRPSMARTFFHRGFTSSSSALWIVDDDMIAHADWSSSLVKIDPGENLTVEWNEIYNIARGSETIATYGPLPVGHYRFLFQQIDVFGRPIGEEHSVAFIVPLPYWRSLWFLTGCAMIAATLLLLVARYWIRANFRHHLERTRWIEQERLRIARDLHDDLGARLAHLSLMSAQAERETTANKVRESFQEITGMTRELVSALSEVVWTVNPENDHLESLVSFLCHLIHALCKHAPVRCRIDALDVIDNRPVASSVRHHVSLAVKEAVNNALKHSGATEIRINIRFESSLLTILISDNGNGLEERVEKKGNGMANMQHRMAMVGGKISIKSERGNGTTVRFEIPIK